MASCDQSAFSRLLLTHLIFSQLLQFHFAIAQEELIFQNLTDDPEHIFLESKYSYSVTLKLHKKDHRDDDPPGRTLNYQIRAPDYSYFGIMAVVQNLYLRTHKEDTHGIPLENIPEQLEGESKCRDYIQFFKHNRKESSGKICGSLYKGDLDFNTSLLIGPRVFYSDHGALKVRLHVDNNIFGYDKDDPYLVGVEIVFTAYTVCPNTNVGIRTLKRCSEVESISCVSSSLFCDGKIDCGFENEFALDEMRCFTSKYYKYVIVLIIFICFLVLLIYTIAIKIKKKTACP